MGVWCSATLEAAVLLAGGTVVWIGCVLEYTHDRSTCVLHVWWCVHVLGYSHQRLIVGDNVSVVCLCMMVLGLHVGVVRHSCASCGDYYSNGGVPVLFLSCFNHTFPRLAPLTPARL